MTKVNLKLNSNYENNRLTLNAYSEKCNLGTKPEKEGRG